MRELKKCDDGGNPTAERGLSAAAARLKGPQRSVLQDRCEGGVLHLVFNDDDHLVSPQPYRLDLVSERKFPDVLFPLIVPYDDLIRGEPPVVGSPH